MSKTPERRSEGADKGAAKATVVSEIAEEPDEPLATFETLARKVMTVPGKLVIAAEKAERKKKKR